MRLVRGDPAYTVHCGDELRQTSKSQGWRRRNSDNMIKEPRMAKAWRSVE